MKKVITIILILLTIVSFGQSPNDLKGFVDSIAIHDLKLDPTDLYKLDSIYQGSLKNKGIVVRDKDNSLPYPLIIINKKPFEARKLSNSFPSGVKSVATMKPEQAVVLFGSDGKYGAIILEVRKELYKELKRKP